MKIYLKRLNATITTGIDAPQSNWKNETDTGEENCSRCGSWIKHWEFVTGQRRPSKCSVFGCTKPVTDGTHIFNYKRQVQGHWIAPTCHECNVSIKTPFTLNKNVVLVNAECEYSCARVSDD